MLSYAFQLFLTSFIGTVSIPCSADVKTNEVFKYLSINAEKYKMDPAKITKIDDSGEKIDSTAGQTILSYMYYTSKSQNKGEFQKLTSGSRRDIADFDGNVVITLSPSNDKEVLNLNFFVVLTNRRELYPRRFLKSKMSNLKTRRKRTFSGNERTEAVFNSDESQISGKLQWFPPFLSKVSSCIMSQLDGQNISRRTALLGV